MYLCIIIAQKNIQDLKYRIIIDSIAFLCIAFLAVSSYMEKGFGGLTGLCIMFAVCASVELIGSIHKYKKQSKQKQKD